MLLLLQSNRVSRVESILFWLNPLLVVRVCFIGASRVKFNNDKTTLSLENIDSRVPIKLEGDLHIWVQMHCDLWADSWREFQMGRELWEWPPVVCGSDSEIWLQNDLGCTKRYWQRHKVGRKELKLLPLIRRGLISSSSLVLHDITSDDMSWVGDARFHRGDWVFEVN